MFDGLRLEVVVSFVDIGRIVDHHCLHFLLIVVYLENNISEKSEYNKGVFKGRKSNTIQRKRTKGLDVVPIRD